ncbi:hypothetical protein RFI_33071, partial [Reticulomyxa filosa]
MPVCQSNMLSLIQKSAKIISAKYKYICDIDNKVYVKQCLVVFVNKNDAVKLGQVVQHSYSKISKQEKIAYAEIYRMIRVTVTIKGKEYVEKEQQTNYKVPDL